MQRRNFIKTIAATGATGVVACSPFSVAVAGERERRGKAPEGEMNDREYWTDLMYKIASPVLSNMAKGELRKNMTVEVSPNWDGRDKAVTYMECFGRLMSGLAPWLSLPDDDTPEGKQRKQLREWALASYAHSVDPGSPDYLLWRN